MTTEINHAPVAPPVVAPPVVTPPDGTVADLAAKLADANSRASNLTQQLAALGLVAFFELGGLVGQ